ncbi:MatE_and transmembrane domain-containing protein [Hexamita inflata]|uniref:MatE and transmembrane domain-containing protein n=1 Tax=Hexamita inflata TaxID=28002 RepID=A0AA86UNB9_9EUKA|nr:MatE and transmembrane domain-containing protein [Hexamita inflata]
MEARSQHSTAHTTSSINSISFDILNVVVNSTHSISIISNLLPSISKIVCGFSNIIWLMLAYFTCGQQEAIVVIITWFILFVIEFIVNSPINGVQKAAHQRLFSEQYTSGVQLFIHSIVISLVFGVFISIAMWVAVNNIQDKVLTQVTYTGNYFKIMLKVIPIMLPLSKASFQILNADNNIIKKAFMEITFNILQLIFVYVSFVVLSAYGISIKLEYMAWSAVAVNAIFVVVALLFFTLGQNTRFKITVQSLQEFKVKAIWIAIKSTSAYIFFNGTHILILLYCFSLLFSAKTDFEPLILTLGLYLYFQQISGSFSESLRASLVQVLMPNAQMKRYDRITTILGMDFIYLFLTNAFILALLLVSLNSLLQFVYSDLKFDLLDATFTWSSSTIYLKWVELAIIESIFRPFQVIALVSASVLKYNDCSLLLIILKILCSTAQFLTVLLSVNIENCISFIFTVEVTFDAISVLPYLIILVRMHRNRTTVAEIQGMTIDEHKLDAVSERQSAPALDQFIPLPQPGMSFLLQQTLVDQLSKNNSSTMVETSSGNKSGNMTSKDIFSKEVYSKDYSKPETQ